MGVVTEFRFKTFEVPEQVTYFIASVPWTTETRARAGLKAVQEFAKTMPTELNMRMFIASRFTNLEGLYYGDKEGLQAVLAPLLEQTNGTLALIRTGGWLDQVKHFGNGIAIDQQHGYQEVCDDYIIHGTRGELCSYIQKRVADDCGSMKPSIQLAFTPVNSTTHS